MPTIEKCLLVAGMAAPNTRRQVLLTGLPIAGAGLIPGYLGCDFLGVRLLVIGA